MALDISKWLNRELDPGGGLGTRRIDTQVCAIGPDAIEQDLPTFLGDQLGARRLLYVWDATTSQIAGGRVRQALGEHAHHEVADHDGHGPTCDAETVSALRSRLAADRPDAVVAVGSGTVNDVAKAAAGPAGVPYVVVPTAASMNGYTSGIAAVLEDGVKRTTPYPAVLGVFADPALIGRAPAALTRAGLGDLLSKSVCGADWKLCSLLLEEPWSGLPGELVFEAESACIAQAVGIGRGEPEAVATLLEALLLSGISMVLAGSSAPASGAEHLFSHMIDMRRHVTGERLNLHGAQVGVGTLMTAALYEAVLAYPVQERVDPDALAAEHPDWESERGRIERIHGPLAQEIAGCYRPKFRAADDQRRFVTGIVARWPELRAATAEIVRPVDELKAALLAAGAPTTAAEVGVGRDEARELFLVARDMRARYTVLDLAWDLGLLEALADEVLERSGVLRPPGL